MKKVKSIFIDSENQEVSEVSIDEGKDVNFIKKQIITQCLKMSIKWG